MRPWCRRDLYRVCVDRWCEQTLDHGVMASIQKSGEEYEDAFNSALGDRNFTKDEITDVFRKQLDWLKPLSGGQKSIKRNRPS